MDDVAALHELGIGGAHQLGHHVGVLREEGALDAQAAALLDGAAHDAAQHVAAVLVGGDDAVGDQGGHAARVVGEDPHRPGGGLVGVVGAAAQLLAEADERQELVGLEDRRRALLDEGHAVEAHARVDVLLRQRGQDVGRLLVELHEHEVPVLQEALVLPAGQVVRGAELQAAVVVQLRARAAGADRAGLPEVLRARAQHDPVARDADRQPRVDGLLVGAQAQVVVALEDGDPDAVRVELQVLEGELPRELHRALLEVVAHREVAEHLEEREVPGGGADDVDVRGAEALLAAREARRGRVLLPEEVGLQRVHARGGQQHGGIVAGGHERGRGQQGVAPLGEELEVGGADLVGGHRAAESRSVSARWSPTRPRRPPRAGRPSAREPVRSPCR